MRSPSKTLRLIVAFAMLLCCPIVEAQHMVCGPNGCRVVSSASQPVRTVARRVASVPVRVVRRGLFGLRGRYEVQPQAQSSSGSTGSYGTYQTTTQSYGSTGGTAVYESSGSNGGLGSYGDGPTDTRSTAAPVTKAAPAASVPLSKAECSCGPDCNCGPDCDCQTQVCTVPPAAPSTRYCIVPPTSVSSTCRVPASAPSVEAVASL